MAAMRFFASATSPYARVIRVAALERGLGERVEHVVVRTRVPDSPVNAMNPTGKVPTLETPEGVFLSESRLICQYFDTLHDGPPLVDLAPSLELRALDGVITGFLDGLSVWVRELRRPEGERSPGILAQERARADRVLAYLEAQTGWRSAATDYPRICLAVGLELLAHVLAPPDLVMGEGVDAWRREAAARSSMRATEPGAG